MKERCAITDMRKLVNRMQFGIPEESSLGDGLGEGYGVLGNAGSRKLCVSIGQNKLAAKAAKRQFWVEESKFLLLSGDGSLGKKERKLSMAKVSNTYPIYLQNKIESNLM